MKRLFYLILIAFYFLTITSCSSHKTVVINKKTVKGLKTLQTWVEEDYKNGEIPYANANNYFIILESIIEDLNKEVTHKTN